ncbi:hypothetical protein CHS0354_010622 [Potamilus streckersoni]|uniref:Nuclear receptor coactivator 6 TRADD-N domain-containing protein n=1 Tax=Potamilus streckersoni TaxID=2493646 RepID=A0AAE0VW55_9BIVA|nr:hypothetical protein CHS0354_010622 [Potamilus streckersoni]
MGPQEDYIETVFTCEGNFDDPHLQARLDDFRASLKDLLLTEKNKLILKKVEPWNSVRVTFNIPREAAGRLRQLAQQGSARLRELGVLGVQIQGDQHISLTIAGKNNERTHLVFKTSDSSVLGPPKPVFDSKIQKLDELGAPGPGQESLEASKKNIAEYLRPGSSIFDSIFGSTSSSSDIFKTPDILGATCDQGPFRSNNVIPSPTVQGGSAIHGTPPFGYPPCSSPNFNPLSPSRSPGPKFPAQTPGIPPGIQQNFPVGRGNSFMGLPPPPPYPHGSSVINKFNSLRAGTSATSPLLVNLLQTDPSLAGFNNILAGKITGIDPNEKPKKKKKSRKPKEGKAKSKSKSASGEVPYQSVPNPTQTSANPTTGTLSLSQSVPVLMQPLPSSAPSVSNQSSYSSLMNDSSFTGLGLGNGMTSQSSTPSPKIRKVEHESPESTAGKIVNPYTGLLEPMENLSDLSPTKSESGGETPLKSARNTSMSKSTFSSTLSINSIDSIIRQVRTDSVKLMAEKEQMERDSAKTPQSPPQLTISFQTAVNTVLKDHTVKDFIRTDFVSKSLDSGHLEVFHSNVLQQQQQQEQQQLLHEKQSRLLDSLPVGLRTLQKAGISDSDERMLSVSDPVRYSLELIREKNKVIPDGGLERRHTIGGHAGPHIDLQHSLGHSQEMNSLSSKTIPPLQLLNKPLLQVKQNNVGTLLSGSPDNKGHSDVDSENSSHSITAVEGHNVSEPVTVSSGTHVDTSLKSYSNDSGVGSSSERSDDTPSEPGDNDFKSGQTNLDECAKSHILNSSLPKQIPTTKLDSKVMTVGYAVVGEVTHRNITNETDMAYLHKHLNMKSDPMRSKSDMKHLVPDLTGNVLHWTAKDELRPIVNTSDMTAVMTRNKPEQRKSPKSSSPRPAAGFPVQHPDHLSSAMQGNPDNAMQKKKNSPRNSPRGSPRNSPRNSPRMLDMVGVQGMPGISYSKQTLLTAQEYAAHLPNRNNDQNRKSPIVPFPPSSLSSVSTAPFPSVPKSNTGESAVDVLSRFSPQCSMEAPSIMKTSEGHPPSLHQLSQLASLDPQILQKLGPFFSQLQNLPFPSQNTSGEMRSRSPRSPLGGPPRLPGSSAAGFSLSELHQLFAETLQNSQIPGLGSSSSGEKEKTSVNGPGTKGAHFVPKTLSSSSVTSATVDSPKGTNITSIYGRKSSPAGAMLNSLTYHSDSSLLPLPKRLTESVQKVVKPLPSIDNSNSLPHVNRRSPSISVSSTGTASSRSAGQGTSSPPRSGPKPGVNGKPSAITTTPAYFMDSLGHPAFPVTSSFTLHSEADFGHPPLRNEESLLPNPVHMDEVHAPNTLPVISEKSLTSVTLTVTRTCACVGLSQTHSVTSVSNSTSTSVVPAVIGTILSPKTYTLNEAHSAHNSAHLSSRTSQEKSSSSVSRSLSTQVYSARAESPMSFQTSIPNLMCNKDTAVNCASDSDKVSVSTFIGSSVQGISPSLERSQTSFLPLNARLHNSKGPEKPKSPFQSMGLSEMLQETAILHSISTQSQAVLTQPQTSVLCQMRQPLVASGIVDEEVNSSNGSGAAITQGDKLGAALHIGMSVSNRSGSDNPCDNAIFDLNNSTAVDRSSRKDSVDGSTSVYNNNAASTTTVNGHTGNEQPVRTTEHFSANSASQSSEQIAHASLNSLHDSILDSQQHLSDKFSSDTIENNSLSLNESVLTTTAAVTLQCCSVKESFCVNEMPSQPSLNEVQDSSSLQPGPPDLRSYTADLESSASTDNSNSSGPPNICKEDSPVHTVESKTALCNDVTSQQNLSEQLVMSQYSEVVSAMHDEDREPPVLTEIEGLCTHTGDEDSQHYLRPLKTGKKLRSSFEEGFEDTSSIKAALSGETDAPPMQLRSRKRTNTGDGENSNSSDDHQPKKLKVDSSDSNVKVDLKDSKGMRHIVNANVVNMSPDYELANSLSTPTLIDTVKSGLRARSNTRNVPLDEKAKAAQRDCRKDVKTAVAKASVVDKKDSTKAVEDSKKNMQLNRRNRQSPSATPENKVVNHAIREKSPLRVSRTRGRNSPTVEHQEETQENKRTTRSARSKDPMEGTYTCSVANVR